MKKIFRYSLGYPLHLEAPETFNEKLNRLKLYGFRIPFSDYIYTNDEDLRDLHFLGA